MIYIDLTNALGSASDRHEVTMSTNCGVFQRDLEKMRNCLFVYRQWCFRFDNLKNVDDCQNAACANMMIWMRMRNDKDVSCAAGML